MSRPRVTLEPQRHQHQSSRGVWSTKGALWLQRWLRSEVGLGRVEGDGGVEGGGWWWRVVVVWRAAEGGRVERVLSLHGFGSGQVCRMSLAWCWQESGRGQDEVLVCKWDLWWAVSCQPPTPTTTPPPPSSPPLRPPRTTTTTTLTHV